MSLRTEQVEAVERLGGQELVALGEIGPAAAQAIPDIEPLLEDRDQEVRAAAADALMKIRREAIDE